MIKRFKDKEAEMLFIYGRPSRRLRFCAKVALRKLIQIHAVGRIDELAIPPGNRLKRISETTWQLRVNDQYRIRFRWYAGDAYDVEIADFH